MADYSKPSYTTDAVVFAYERSIPDLWILLIERGKDPFKGDFALPGGFVNEGETSREACARELVEETNLPLSPEQFFQVGVFDAPGRDPRGWCVDSAFATLVDYELVNPLVKAGDDAAGLLWFSLSNSPPQLAFDHLEIINRAVAMLSWMLDGNSPFMEFENISLKDRETLKTILNFEERQDETETGQEDAEAEGSTPPKRSVGCHKPARAVDAAGRKARREPEAERDDSGPSFQFDECFGPRRANRNSN